MIQKSEYLIWNCSNIPQSLPIYQLDLSIQNGEYYADKDLPGKFAFIHPWQNWAGVDITYEIQEETVVGSRGKIVWYIPLIDKRIASLFDQQIGTALKIIKFPVFSDPNKEWERIKTEFEIQNYLFKKGLAPRCHNIIGIQITKDINVHWFEHLLFYPKNSILIAVIVDHIEHTTFPSDITLFGDEVLKGPKIDTFIERCKLLGVIHRDICLGNLLFSKERLIVVDVHKWKWMN